MFKVWSKMENIIGIIVVLKIQLHYITILWMLFLDQWVRSVLNQESKKMKPGNKCT